MQENRDNRLSPESDQRRESQLLDLLAPFANCNPPFSYSANNRCTNRGLIPGHLLASLQVLEFLCATVLSAQKAQRSYGVRASVLLAMALAEAAFNIRDLVRDPQIFCDREVERHAVSPEIDRWFRRRAKRLNTKLFEKALRCPNAKSYLMDLCDLGYHDSLEALDLCDIVETYELEQCDLAGMLPIGEYSNGQYDTVKDAAGNVTGLKASPYVDFLQRRGEDAVAA